MSAFDGNRDGRVDRLEANDAREFSAGDKNHDGALNRSEFARVDSKLIHTAEMSGLLMFLFLKIQLNSISTMQIVMVLSILQNLLVVKQLNIDVSFAFSLSS